MKDPYMHENGVLKNKLQITSADKLNLYETKMTAARFVTLEKSVPTPEQLSFEYLKEIHKYIFQDVYEWAGTPRTIPIEKSESVLGGDTIRYSLPKDIVSKTSTLIDGLNKANWKAMDLEHKVDMFSKGYAALWKIHPFREGNTRTTTHFMCSLAEKKGFELDKSIILAKDNSIYLRNSLVKASDGQYSDYNYLKKIVKDSVIQGQQKFADRSITKAGFLATEKLTADVIKASKIAGKNVTVAEIKQMYNNKGAYQKDQRIELSNIVKDFVSQELELKKIMERKISTPQPEP